MRAFALDAFDTAPGFRADLPEPDVGANDLLVRVRTSSVNPVDVFIAGGYLREMAEYAFPVILGRDFAGTIEEIGPSVGGYAVGDEVFGFVPHVNPAVHDGSWAELIAVPGDDACAPRPTAIGFEEAGAAPLAGLTALAAFDALAPTAGETILVVGATGGVGSFFVQLAAAAGATVIAPALDADGDHLRGLGVTELVDRNGDIAGAVRAVHPAGVDAILDLVSEAPDTSLLDADRRLASTLGAAGEGAGRFNVMAVSNRANLERLAALLDTRALRVPVERRYSLEQAADALQALPTMHTQGKLGLTIT